MPTITAGATGTYTFTSTANAASVTLAQGVRAVFVVTSSAGALLASDNIQASRVLGPYPVGATMSLTAINGSADYTAVDADNYFAGQVGLNADSQVIDEAGSPVSGGGSSAPTYTQSAVARPVMLLVGNSLTGQSGRTGASYQAAVAAETKAGNNQITLSAGGVAAMGLTGGDYVVVSLCNQQAWPVQVASIATETLTLSRRLPLLVRATAGVAKVTPPILRGGVPRIFPGISSVANHLIGGAFDIVPIHGHGSALAAEIIEALPRLLAFYRPARAILQLFENDVAATSDVNLLIALADRAAGMCLAMGCVPVVLHSAPSSSFGAGVASTNYDTLKAAILAIGTRVPGAKGADPAGVYLDTVAAGRKPLAGWTDGVHPADSYKYSAGQALAPVLATLTDGAWPKWGILGQGPNVTLAGTGGTAANLQGGSVVPANTTITATGGGSTVLTTSKTAGGALRMVCAWPTASNVSSTQAQVSQTYTIPKTWGPRTAVKIFADIEIVSASGLNAITLGAATGGVNHDFRTISSTTAPMDTAMIGRRLVIESDSALMLDPTATTSVLTLGIRPLTLGSPSGAAFEIIVHAIGWVVTPYDEMERGALDDQ